MPIPGVLCVINSHIGLQAGMHNVSVHYQLCTVYSCCSNTLHSWFDCLHFMYNAVPLSVCPTHCVFLSSSNMHTYCVCSVLRHHLALVRAIVSLLRVAPKWAINREFALSLSIWNCQFEDGFPSIVRGCHVHKPFKLNQVTKYFSGLANMMFQMG